jgi:hypothetical protein
MTIYIKCSLNRMNCLNLPIVCAFGEARFGKDQEQQRAVEYCNQGKSRNIGKIDKKPIASPFKAVLSPMSGAPHELCGSSIDVQ